MIETGTATKIFHNTESNDDVTWNFDSSVRTSSRSDLNNLITIAADSTLSSISVESKGDEIKEVANLDNSPIERIRDIYFDDFISSELKTSVNLLEKSQTYIFNSLASFQKGRLKESDEFIMEFKRFLPELFCCRTVSESFGAVINSIAIALNNMNGFPLSETQLVALHTLVTALLREPAMSFQKAVEYVSDFEDADFEVETESLQTLLSLVEMMDEPQSELNIDAQI